MESPIVRRLLFFDGASVALVRIIGLGSGFALTVVLARGLDAEELGLYGYAVTLLSLTAIPVSNGWATLLLRSSTRNLGQNGGWAESNGISRWALRFSLVMVCLVFIIVWALAKNTLIAYSSLVFSVVFSATLFFNQLSALRLAILRALGHPVFGQVPEMLLRPLIILGLFSSITYFTGFAKLEHAFIALLVASAVSALAGNIILRIKRPPHITNIAPAAWNASWAKSVTILSSNAGLIVLNGQVDFLILGLLGTATDLGHYRIAMQVGLISGFVYVALNMVAMQRFALFLAKKEHYNLQQAASFMARLAFLGSLPLFIIVWIWGGTLLDLTFGAKYKAALPPLLWLLGLQIINSFFGFSRTCLVMAEREARILPITVFALTLNIILCIILIPNFGIAGAAIASFSAQALWNFLLAVIAFRELHIDSTVIGYSTKKLK